MGEIYFLLISSVLVSLFVAFLTTPLVITFACRLGIVDNPRRRLHPATLHSKSVPRGGGIPVYVAILVASLLFLTIDKRLTGVLVGGFIVVAIGFLDDRKDMNPYIRLLGQFLAALLVVGSGIGIAFISGPLGGIIDLSGPKLGFELLGEHREIWIISSFFALLWIVGLMNAVSWSSGVDGQLSGFVSIAALITTLLSLRFSMDMNQWPVIILSAIVFGAFLGFLPWHMYPQKIMPGFGGATLGGYMLAVLSILATAKVGTLLLVLAIPVIDALYIILRRILAGKSPVWGDRGHLHHRLLDAGFSKQQVAIFYWVATALLGIVSLYLNAAQKFYIIIGIALSMGGLILWINSFLQLSKRAGRASG